MYCKHSNHCGFISSFLFFSFLCVDLNWICTCCNLIWFAVLYLREEGCVCVCVWERDIFIHRHAQRERESDNQSWRLTSRNALS